MCKYLLSDTCDREEQLIIVEADSFSDMENVVITLMKDAMDDQSFDPATSEGQDDTWGYNSYPDINRISAWYNRNSGTDYDWYVLKLEDIRTVNAKELM